jgi:hypothetical protein
MPDLEIFQRFLEKEKRLFEGAELIVHFMASAAVTKSVESVVESWGSTMELLSSKNRNIGQERLQNELMVSINGPKIMHSDTIIKEALERMNRTAVHVKDRIGHFVRRSENVETFLTSRVVDRLNKEKPKIPFMS